MAVFLRSRSRLAPRNMATNTTTAEKNPATESETSCKIAGITNRRGIPARRRHKYARRLSSRVLERDKEIIKGIVRQSADAKEAPTRGHLPCVSKAGPRTVKLYATLQTMLARRTVISHHNQGVCALESARITSMVIGRTDANPNRAPVTTAPP
jgi:hypothetical protein